MCFCVRTFQQPNENEQRSKSRRACVNVACNPQTLRNNVKFGGAKKEKKTWKPNKIIYCLSICEILFDYNSHISIIFLLFAIQFSLTSMSTLTSGRGRFSKGKFL